MTTLDYAAPFRRHGHMFRRFVLLGPVSGAMAELMSVAVALCNWVYFGEPDLYFRGWSGMEQVFMVHALMGGLFGLFLACAIVVFEHRSNRRVRVGMQLVWMATISIIGFGIISHFEIRLRWLAPVFSPDGIVFTTGLLVAILSSAPANSQAES